MSSSIHASLSDVAKPCFLAGVGSGISAAGAVAGGADLLAVYNTAICRAFWPFSRATIPTASRSTPPRP